MFVMLSSVPVAQDSGNPGTLPNGEKVKLRETFPASGLYEIGSKVPIWTVNWYGEEGLVKLSKDGRYVVRVNRFGGGGYGEGIVLRWGIAFYEQGRAVKRHHVSDLVDYPSLMSFTSSDWHFLWIDDSIYDSEISDEGTFVLATTTHERYRFDVTTGQIVEQHRLWKSAAQKAFATLVLGVAVGGYFARRRMKVSRSQAARRRSQLDSIIECGERTTNFSYSLRSLMIAVTAAAMLSATFCFAVHVGVFLSAFVLSIAFTLLLVKSRQRSLPSPKTTLRWRLLMAVIWVATLASWLLLYVLSVGPVLQLAHQLHWPDDCRTVLLKVVYGPVVWLDRNTGIFGWEPMELYFRAWRI